MKSFNIIKTLSLFIAGLLLIGCALKESDTTPQRVLKYTANAPAYIIVGAGAIAHQGSRLILTGILVPPYAAYKYLTKDANNTEFPKADLRTALSRKNDENASNQKCEKLLLNGTESN